MTDLALVERSESLNRAVSNNHPAVYHTVMSALVAKHSANSSIPALSSTMPKKKSNRPPSPGPQRAKKIAGTKEHARQMNEYFMGRATDNDIKSKEYQALAEKHHDWCEEDLMNAAEQKVEEILEKEASGPSLATRLQAARTKAAAEAAAEAAGTSSAKDIEEEKAVKREADSSIRRMCTGT
ncbi:hypothetical protein FZEAL_6248 [Fusarium zealandicum]|uniref:Uncharacterized protein n=1 Tax=Fusarium zealandicum TaxID=1053134 RepID=A0A8H4UIG5_9HYPO|nr:hypothetical protein FZEAL_6248 [Fusarium zealandicum]